MDIRLLSATTTWPGPVQRWQGVLALLVYPKYWHENGSCIWFKGPRKNVFQKFSLAGSLCWCFFGPLVWVWPLHIVTLAAISWRWSVLKLVSLSVNKSRAKLNGNVRLHNRKQGSFSEVRWMSDRPKANFKYTLSHCVTIRSRWRGILDLSATWITRSAIPAGLQ